MRPENSENLFLPLLNEPVIIDHEDQTSKKPIWEVL